MIQTALNFDGPILSDEQRRVWAYLCKRRGREAALPMPDLAALAYGDCNATRRVQTVVAQLVALGYPIGSSSAKPHNGYYIIIDADELEAACAQLMNRIKELSRRRKSLKKHRAKLRGQTSLLEASCE